MKDWSVSRRELLKRLGVGVACLPLLDAELAYGQSTVKKRLFIVASTLGYRPFTWPSLGSLAGQTLPDTLSPLEPYKSDLILLPKMTNPSYTGCLNCGVGAYGTIYYGGPETSSEYKEPALAGPAGFTVDQVVADGLYARNPTPAKSLALQAEVDTYLADGTTGAHRCFWRGAGQPVNPIMDPYLAYSMYLLGSTTPTPNPAAVQILTRRRSILDFVGKDLTRFGNRLGTSDQQKIQSYFTAIRDLEETLSLGPNGTGGATNPPIDFTEDLAAQSDPACKSTTAINGASSCFFMSNVKYPAVLDLHMRVGVLALASGATQVVTLQALSATGDAKAFSFIPGVPGNPALSQRNGQDLLGLSRNPIQGGVDVKQLVDKWFMTQFANLIQYMKSVTEGGQTLLDHSVVLWGNTMESGDTRNAQAVPWLMAGSAGGYFKTGQRAASDGLPINGALSSICSAMGVAPTPTFGQPMPGLT